MPDFAPIYSPGLRYQVLRGFLAGDNHQYLPGDMIDAGELPERLLRLLAEQRRIRAIITKADEAAAKREAQKPAKAPAKIAVVQEAAPEIPKGLAGLSSVHRGFGKWFVTDTAGNDISGPHGSKAEADAIIERAH